MTDTTRDGTGLQGRGAAVRLALLATLGGLCLGLAGDILHDALKDCAGPDVGRTLQGCLLEPAPATVRGYAWSGALAAAFFVLSLLAIPTVRRAFLRSRARIVADGRTPRFKAVVFGLSRLHKLELDGAGLPLDPALAKERSTRQTAVAIAKVRAMRPGELDRTLEELCDADPEGPFAGWQWQQPLRMLRHNRGRLAVWCAVLTKEAEAQWKAFRAVADPLLAELGASLERGGHTVAPHDYNQITHALDDAIRLCQADWGCSHATTCIDMTGGTAAFSAAATVKTLNSQVRLGYVVTMGAPNAGEIVVYEPSVTA
jgi:hypothetical protein